MAIFLILSFSATFATPRAFWFWSFYIFKRSTDRSRKSWKTPILFLAQHRYSWWLSCSESKCTKSCKCCWNESKRKIAAESFIKIDRWRTLSWHDVYLSKLTSTNGAPHRECSCYKSLQWNAHLLQPFRVLIQAGATKWRQEKRGEDRKESTGCRGVASASGDRFGSYLQHIQVSLESMHKFWFYGPTKFSGSFQNIPRAAILDRGRHTRLRKVPKCLINRGCGLAWREVYMRKWIMVSNNYNLFYYFLQNWNIYILFNFFSLFFCRSIEFADATKTKCVQTDKM